MRAVGAELVDVGAGGDQHLGHVDVAVARGEHQRREALVRRAAHTGAASDERFGRSSSLVLRPGPTSAPCMPASFGRGVHFGAAGDERLDHVEVAGPRGSHEGRQPARLRAVRVGARAEQLLTIAMLVFSLARASGVTP